MFTAVFGEQHLALIDTEQSQHILPPPQTHMSFLFFNLKHLLSLDVFVVLHNVARDELCILPARRTRTLI